MAQLVNVIAPIMTNKDEVCKQTIYYPYMAAIRYAKGNALRICVPSDRVETEYGEMSGNLRAYNDFSCPNEVALRSCATENEISGALPLTLPPQSFTVLRYCEQEYI